MSNQAIGRRVLPVRRRQSCAWGYSAVGVLVSLGMISNVGVKVGVRVWGLARGGRLGRSPRRAGSFFFIRFRVDHDPRRGKRSAGHVARRDNRHPPADGQLFRPFRRKDLRLFRDQEGVFVPVVGQDRDARAGFIRGYFAHMMLGSIRRASK